MHVLKRKAVYIPISIVLVLVIAFISYGAYTRSKPTKYRGGPFQVGAGLPTPVASIEPSAGASTGPSASPAAAPSASASAESSIAATAAPTVAPVPTPSKVGNTVLPLLGTYKLAVSGVEKVKFGPITGCTNTFPATSSLTISKAVGYPTNSYNFDLRYYTDDPSRPDERQIYTYGTNRSVSKPYELDSVTCAGVKQASEVDYSPSQLRVASSDLHVGQSWKVNGGGTSRTEKGTFTVTSRTSLTVQGHSYVVYVITSPLTLTGSDSGTRNDTWWWSPALAIPLKYSEAYNAKRSDANYSNNVTASVVALP